MLHGLVFKHYVTLAHFNRYTVLNSRDRIACYKYTQQKWGVLQKSRGELGCFGVHYLC